jgi:hypothetical protein
MPVAHRGDAAHDGAVADRDQNVAVLAEVLEHLDVLLVAAAALDQADRAARPVNFLMSSMGDLSKSTSSTSLQDAVVDVEQRHVAAEAARQRRGRDLGFTIC